MYLIFLFSTIIEQSTKLSDLAGYTARISELLEALEDIKDESEEIHLSNSDHIQFENITLYSPNEKLLVRHLDLSVSEGDRLVITGPNGKCNTTHSFV